MKVRESCTVSILNVFKKKFLVGNLVKVIIPVRRLSVGKINKIKGRELCISC